MAKHVRDVNRQRVSRRRGSELLRLQRRTKSAERNPQPHQYENRVEKLRPGALWLFEGNISLSEQISETMRRTCRYV